MSKIKAPFTFANGVTLRNHLVMAPMTTWSGTDQGAFGQAEYDYYRVRASGVGMVITGTSYMTPNGKGFSGQFFAGDDETLPHLTAMAKTIKDGGAKAILQIFHAGRQSAKSLIGDLDVVSASDIPAERPDAETPRPLTQPEIEAIIQSFADVTKRAAKAGFDGVEIHGANTYLLQQFFSPHSNRRADQWGGSLENRTRFPLAVVDAVLDAAKSIGSDFIVGYRLSPEEIEQPGISLKDTDVLVEMLADTKLSYLHLSLPHYAATSMRNPKDMRVIGTVLAQRLDGRMPLIGVGQVKTLDDAQCALDLGFNLVAVGKSLIYDPDWVAKIFAGETPFDSLSETRRETVKVPKAMFDKLYQLRDWLNVCFEGK